MVSYLAVLDRRTDIALIRTALKRSRVVALLGARPTTCSEARCRIVRCMIRYGSAPARTRTRTRRNFLLGTCGLLVASRGLSAGERGADTPASIAEIERRIGGRLGVFALDTTTNRHISHRAEERFAMCSTFKWLLAAAVLSNVDRRRLSLEEHVVYSSRDLLEYAPVTRQHVAEGFMTVAALAEAAVTISDNTAGNLLLAKIDGPQGFTRFARSLGDRVTRLDRNEPALNANDPGDSRDTTSPQAMVGLMRAALCGEVLLPASRDRLLGWLRACETGRNRLRAGLPSEWSVGDKTGSGSHSAVNDVAIATQPGRAPILIAVYASESGSDLAAVERAHADVARLVVRAIETRSETPRPLDAGEPAPVKRMQNRLA
jgi:beta-lactamase class A